MDMNKELSEVTNNIPVQVTYEIHQVENIFQIRNAIKHNQKEDDKFSDFWRWNRKLSAISKGTKAKNNTQLRSWKIHGKLSNIPEVTERKNSCIFLIRKSGSE